MDPLSAAEREFKEICKDSQSLQETTLAVYDELVDEITLGVIFEVHKSYKRGELNLNSFEIDRDKLKKIFEETEWINQQTPKEQLKCRCPVPSCTRTVVAEIIASHVRMCMGMGRNSSRLANLRFSNTTKDKSENVSTYITSDDEGDPDWMGDKKRKKKDNNKNRKKKDNGKSKSKKSKSRSGLEGISESTSSYSEILNPSSSKSSILSSQICGVVSEHTKKKCTRSIRCTQHTDDQRRAALRAETKESSSVDVEGNDDSDTSFRDMLHDASSNPSPAGSTSSASSSGKRRDKSSKSKKNSKRDKGSSHSQQ